ncbi:hypothetical protein HZC08_01200 [Candidatus Micrarchaeota archaeon]|nr:hypothetical protein [Candidatus Micrarchaeota archaeon]
MAEIEITTDKQDYSSDEVILAEITLNFKKPVKARKIIASICCHEKKKVKNQTTIPPDELRRQRELGIPFTTHLREVETFEESIAYNVEKEIAKEGIYQNEKFKVFFEIPKKCIPTSYVMGHDNKVHKWKLKIKVDVPLRLDLHAEKEIFLTGL